MTCLLLLDRWIERGREGGEALTRGPSSTRRQAAAAATKQPRSLHFLSAFSFAYNNNLGRRKDADDADADEAAEDELPVRPDRPTDRPPRDRPLHLAQ